MSDRPGKTISIQGVMGEALRAVGGNLPFALSVAAAGAAAHGIALVALGGTPIWPALLALVSAAIYAALTRFAMSGGGAVRASLPNDTLRVSASATLIGFFILLMCFVLLYITMGILIGPYADQAKQLADAKNEAGTMALMQRAIAEQQGVVAGCVIVSGLVLFAVTTRFFVAVPQSVANGRVTVFDSWRLTRGNFLRIAAARTALLLPALIFAGALQSLFGYLVGLNPNDILATAAASQHSPLSFLAFFTVAQFLQIAIYTSLEAALSVAIFRALAGQGSTDSAQAR